MNSARKSTRYAALVVASLALALAASSPAFARLDPGGLGADEQTTQSTDMTACSLKRIGTQLVNCDSLTGAGVEAPSWVPER